MRGFWMAAGALAVAEMVGWGQSSGTRTGAAARRPTSTAAKSGTSTAASAQGAALTLASLKTDGLNYGDDVARIYVGDFEHVRLKRDGPELGFLVGGYMNAFSEQCDQYLPKNKVEIMRSECAQEAWSVNGYGAEMPGSRHCVSYRSVGTGRFADPEVYALQSKTDAAMAGNMLGGYVCGYEEWRRSGERDAEDDRHCCLRRAGYGEADSEQ